MLCLHQTIPDPCAKFYNSNFWSLDSIKVLPWCLIKNLWLDWFCYRCCYCKWLQLPSVVVHGDTWLAISEQSKYFWMKSYSFKKQKKNIQKYQKFINAVVLCRLHSTTSRFYKVKFLTLNEEHETKTKKETKMKTKQTFLSVLEHLQLRKTNWEKNKFFSWRLDHKAINFQYIETYELCPDSFLSIINGTKIRRKKFLYRRSDSITFRNSYK